MWLGSLTHLCGKIKIRCLQNENSGSSPARPWYCAGNIKSIPRFRHFSPKKKKNCSISTGIAPLWLKLDVLVVGMKQSLFMVGPPTPPCHCHQPLLLSPSKVRLIYISQTCSFLLRNRFSWSVGAGLLSLRYPAGTAQPSSQMAVFQRNKTYEFNFISLSGLWYVESSRFISTLIPMPVYCFGTLMHEGGFRNQNLPGI